MANIDLVVNFSHPDAVSNTIRYARIDNTVTPVYTTIPGILPGDNPYTISSVPNGQYRVYILPIYADGRSCPESVFTTPACSGINAFNASYDGSGNISVVYSAEGSLPSVRVNINYPNGGTASQIFTNGDSISMSIPPNLAGTYIVTMQPVCDSDTGFFGVSTAPVNVPVTVNETVLIQTVDPHFGAGNRISNVTGISGFTFGSQVNEGETQTGTHGAFSGIISVTVIQAFADSSESNGVMLRVNGVDTECIGVAGGSLFGETLNFGYRTYAATDVIEITYDYNVCEVSVPGLFLIDNNSATATIVSVTPEVFEIGTGSFPIAPGGDIDATHTGFATLLNIAVSGVVGDIRAELRRNGDLLQCITFNADGNSDFAAFTFDIGDDCSIAVYDGACP